jgi:uncharacterized protein
MSIDRPDDLDDIPIPRAVPPGDDGPPDEFADLRPPSRPGFGFWMSVVWCLLFFVVTQIVIGLCACGLPITFVAAAIEATRQNGPPQDPNQVLKSDLVMIGLVLSIMCAHLGGILFSWLVLRWQVGRQWKRKIALTRRPTVTHALLTLVGLVAMLAVSTCLSALIDQYIPTMEDLFRWIGFNFPMKGANETIPELVKASPFLLALFVVGVMPALDEELWCRGFIANGLSHRYPTWAVIGITSFLFGAIHVDPRQGLGAMFLGVAIHGAYVATRSIWVAMALHFMNNGLGVVHLYFKGHPLAVLQPFEDVFEHGSLGLKILFAAVSVLLFATVAYAFYQTRCKLVAVDPTLPVWEPPSRSGVELPPRNSGTVVAHERLSPTSTALVLAGAVVFGLVLWFA